MQIQTNQLINELLTKTSESTDAAKKFQSLSEKELNFKNNENEWSILECIEHLNLYGDYYLVEIEKKMLAQKRNAPSGIFKSGIIGNYFANLMLVKDGQIKKMKSPKDKNPVNSELKITTIDRFLKHQERLESLLDQARYVNLTKTKTAISLTKMIQLRLGDTFRFFVYHIERHILQAKRNLPD